MWVLELKPGSSARATNALSPRAIFLVPFILSFLRQGLIGLELTLTRGTDQVGSPRELLVSVCSVGITSGCYHAGIIGSGIKLRTACLCSKYFTS